MGKFTGMVEVDGVRFRKEDLERLHPDRVKDAKEVPDPERGPSVQPLVDTVPGGVVTGADGLGNKVIDTTNSAAANGVGPDVVSETVGLVAENADADDKPAARTRSKK